MFQSKFMWPLTPSNQHGPSKLEALRISLFNKYLIVCNQLGLPQLMQFSSMPKKIHLKPKWTIHKALKLEHAIMINPKDQDMSLNQLMLDPRMLVNSNLLLQKGQLLCILRRIKCLSKLTKEASSQVDVARTSTMLSLPQATVLKMVMNSSLLRTPGVINGDPKDMPKSAPLKTMFVVS